MRKQQEPPYNTVNCIQYLVINCNGSVESLSLVQLFVMPWTVAWRLLYPWGFSTKNTGMSCHSLLQKTFLTQELNSGLLHCRWVLCQLSHQGNPQNIWSVYLMLEIHPRGQKDVKGKGTVIKLSLEMMRFFGVFFFSLSLSNTCNVM